MLCKFIWNPELTFAVLVRPIKAHYRERTFPLFLNIAHDFVIFDFFVTFFRCGSILL